MKNVAICCGAHGVGTYFTTLALEQYGGNVNFVCLERANNAISHLTMQAQAHEFIYENEQQLLKQLKEKKPELLVLAWWPYIIHDEILSLGIPVINLHPSYLPFNRGKYPAYWAIVDDTPFGATIHRVDAGVDTGGILWQAPVSLDPTDTGDTAYQKAVFAMRDLCGRNLRDIMTINLPEPIEQDESKATSHHSSEFLAGQTIQSIYAPALTTTLAAVSVSRSRISGTAFTSIL
jgi:methionyl-tRNA formyltransferase